MAVGFGDVQASDFGNGNGVLVLSYQGDVITRADISFTENSEIKPCPATCEEPFHHVVGLESCAELVAWHTWLGDDHLSRPNQKLIADAD